jgi:hypothetical protein
MRKFYKKFVGASTIFIKTISAIIVIAIEDSYMLVSLRDSWS